jgi:hypothetical protein
VLEFFGSLLQNASIYVDLVLELQSQNYFEPLVEWGVPPDDLFLLISVTDTFFSG